MVMLLVGVAYVSTVCTAENNCWASTLVLENVSIRYHLFAATFSVTALEFDLREQITCNSVDLIELAVTSAERAVIWVLCEPVPLAISANWFLANLTLKWILQNVITDAAD